MPLIWDETLYNQAYSNPPSRSGDFAGLMRHYRSTYGFLEDALPVFNRNSDILVVGCGFGYTMEVMLDLGATSVWGTDISPFIQANKAKIVEELVRQFKK